MYYDQSISTSTIFARLRGMLEKDLNVIHESLAETTDEQSKALLESLRAYKLQQIDRLPEISPINESTGTPMAGMKQFSYSMVRESIDTSDSVQLIDKILTAEEAQYNFVQQFDKPEGLPDELLEKLQSILKAYLPVIEQLDRMKSTNRISAIVLNA